MSAAVAPMRIAQMISTGVSNGAARHCLALAESLASRGHHVILLHREGLDVSAAEMAGVRCTVCGFKRTRGELAGIRALLRAEGVQVVQTHMSSAHAFGVILRLMGGPPVVATAHARHLQLHWAFNDLVIAPYEAAAAYQRFVNRVPRGRLVVIPSVLGAQRPEPSSPARRARARKLLGLPDQSLVIGLVGDIVIEKRQSDLIRAARPLLAKRDDVVIVLLGDPVHPREIRRLDRASIGLESRILRLGRRPDVVDLLPGFDIFAFTSVREEMPLALAEAMVAGLPLVTTSVGRIGEVVKDGWNGLLVKPRDLGALAERLQRLADDAALRERLGRTAREYALVEFSTAAAIDRIEAALARVAWPARKAAERAAGLYSDASRTTA
jgi:glycosyltransferase involved in cell wall biosynthesis